MSSQVEQIKERLGITDVVSSYIKIEKSGANYKARCPFHNEKTPSFFISPGRNTYYCFGCGSKGDIFSFVQEFEGVDFMGSLRILAQRAGVELVKENPKARTEREHLYSCLESAAILFQKNLYTKDEHKDAVQYLLDRGLTKETIKEWRIGFAEEGWRTMLSYLLERKFTISEMDKVGVIKKKDGADVGATQDYYDRFRGRIMFPLFDNSGRVIGFSGRVFKGDEKIAKYLNSPETEFFHKSSVLYGFHKAKNSIRERDFSILVEGQMDLLMSQQAGFTNTVAVSGTALTTDHLEMLKRLSDKVVMVFDPDGAGVRAAERGANIALALGMEVKVAALPDGEDPAELILKHPEKWQKAIESATHVIEFLVDHLVEKKKAGGLDDRALASELRASVLPLVAGISSAMEQGHFVSLIYKKTGIREEAIWEDVRKIGKTAAITPTGLKEEIKTKLTRSRKNSIERKILGILMWQETSGGADSKGEKKIQKKEVSGKMIDILPLDTKALRTRFDTIVGAERSKDLIDSAEKDRDELILEAEVTFDRSDRLQIEIDELLVNLEEDYLKDELNTVLAELSRAERDNDHEKAKSLLSKCKELSEKISKLPKSK